MEDDKKIKKWLADELSDEELAEFQKEADYQSLVRLDRALTSFKSPEYDVEEELLKSHQNKASMIGNSWVRPWMKVAAAILLVASLVYLFIPEQGTNITNIVAESTKLVTLPDSSTVLLNKGAKLSFETARWDNQREVALSGEAFFEVKKGSSFQVVTSEGNVKVLGTAFNVVSWDGYFGVDCYHGKVSVTKEAKESILLANQRLQFINNEGGDIESSYLEQPTWMSGESHFESVPLKFVLEEFERQYDLTIKTKSININESFYGSFIHSNKVLALESITIPLNLHYEINDSVVILMSEIPD